MSSDYLNGSPINTIPATPPPPGTPSNLVNPPSKGYLTIIICILTVTLSTPFIALRLYTRKFINRHVWWDDWCCIIGWIFEITLVGLLIDILRYGGGSDRWNISIVKDWAFSIHFQNVLIISQTGMFFTKASIVLLYHRLFLPPGIGRSIIWWSVWFVFYWNLLCALAFIVLEVTCVALNGSNMNFFCGDAYIELLCANVVNVVSDLMILIIPIAVIWRLHMAKEKKIKLGAIFAVGLLGVFASVVRLGYLIYQSASVNRTITYIIIMEMNIAELMIGLIVSSMPSVPAFTNHLRGASPAAISFEPLSQRVRRKPDRRADGAHMGLDDPSLLCSANSGHWDNRYEEMAEGQDGTQTKREGLEEGMDDTTRRSIRVDNRVG